jgi:hypothetical protein
MGAVLLATRGFGRIELALAKPGHVASSPGWLVAPQTLVHARV